MHDRAGFVARGVRRVGYLPAVRGEVGSVTRARMGWTTRIAMLLVAGGLIGNAVRLLVEVFAG